MIKFFRNIRLNQLNDGKTTKYLKYAIGEILLVVIGILIALQINNWNENQKADANTLSYIDRMIDDLRKDSLMLTGQIQSAQHRNEFSKELREILDNKIKIQDTSHFIIGMQAIGRLDMPYTNNNTYQDLVNTGNLKLIKDKNIIEAIRQYYNTIPEEWYKTYHNQLVNGYLPLAVDAIPMHIHERIIENEYNFEQSKLTDTSTYPLTNFSREETIQILSKIRNNKDFDFQLKRVTRSHLVHAKLLSQTLNNAVNLMKQLTIWRAN